MSEHNFEIGDLIELKPAIREIIKIEGVGIIIDKTSIDTTDLLDETIDPVIKAYLIYFPVCGVEYTIPCDCVQFFLPLA